LDNDFFELGQEEFSYKYSIGDLILVNSTARVRRRYAAPNTSKFAYSHAVELVLGRGHLVMVVDYEVISGHNSYVLMHSELGELYSEFGELDCSTVIASISNQ
jgi:hypothetical protein